MKCWNNAKYELIYLMYMILTVCFYIGQNSVHTTGNGLQSFAEFAEEVIYHDPALIRVMLLPPLCILVLFRIRYYFREQFIIRQKNKKRIYLRLLQAGFKEALLFSLFFICISFCAGKIYAWHDSMEMEWEIGKLLIKTFFIFLCMMVIAISCVWIIQSRIAGILLVCLFGFYDTVTCYSGLHFCFVIGFMAASFLTAEKREFYGEKYKNDSV